WGSSSCKSGFLKGARPGYVSIPFSSGKFFLLEAQFPPILATRRFRFNPLLIGEVLPARRRQRACCSSLLLGFLSPAHRVSSSGLTSPSATASFPCCFNPLLIGEVLPARYSKLRLTRVISFQSPSHRGSSSCSGQFTATVTSQTTCFNPLLIGEVL